MLYDFLHHPIRRQCLFSRPGIGLCPKENFCTLIATMSALCLVDRQHAFVRPKPHRTGMHTQEPGCVTKREPFVSHGFHGSRNAIKVKGMAASIPFMITLRA